MLEEARGAESRRDFVSKCSIALKEVREAGVPLRIVEQCVPAAAAEAHRLAQEASEIASILGAIVRNARRGC